MVKVQIKSGGFHPVQILYLERLGFIRMVQISQELWSLVDLVAMRTDLLKYIGLNSLILEAFSILSTPP